ncbi:MAG: MarR family transcriptional regulator [Desulfobacterales bacterium]|nr:MarR family transcriptional regulator [Desulfobacterales bacterium]
MKIKNIKISIKSREAFLEEAKSTMKKIMAGEKVSMKRGLYFENLDAMKKALTPKRLELLHTVKEKRPQSVYELAKGMNRDLKNVTQDLAFLERLGLVELKKTKDKRAKTTPSVEYDKILLEIAV